MKTKNAEKNNIEPSSVQQSLFDSFNPMDSVQRTDLIVDHPLMLPESGYILPTASVKRTLTQVVSAVTSGLPGIAFVAFPRFGKTCATKYISKALVSIFDDLLVLTFIAKYHSKQGELHFFKELLKAFNIGFPQGREIPNFFERLVNGLSTRVITSHSKRIILFIDEAQKLSVDQYSWLIDLSNELGEKNVSLTVILFGQPQLISKREILLHSYRTDIVSRFMVEVKNFDGIRDDSELAEILIFYDDQVISEYPSNSGCACSQFFLPKAYQAGWRLATQSTRLWKAFEAVAQDTGDKAISSGLNIGMTWIKIAVQNILISLMENDAASLKADDVILKNAVERSGFAESIGVLKTFEKNTDARQNKY